MSEVQPEHVVGGRREDFGLGTAFSLACSQLKVKGCLWKSEFKLGAVSWVVCGQMYLFWGECSSLA